jgi:hypothetical protein
MSPFTHAWRLILAALCLDEHARQILDAEIGDCGHCWREVAHMLADIAAGYEIALRGIPELNDYGMVTGAAVDHAQAVLAAALDAAAHNQGHAA